MGKDDFDLVFSDILMPGAMNGIEFARIAKRLYPAIAIATPGA